MSASPAVLLGRPVGLYLCQIERERRGGHNPLLDDRAGYGTARQLDELTSSDDRRRQTDLLLRLRGAASR